MRTTLIQLTLSLILTLLISCSNPLDKKYNRETVEADFKRLVDLEKIDSTEAALMTEFMIKHELIDPAIIEYGATYRDILDEAIKYHQRLEKYAEIDFDANENKKVSEIVRKALQISVIDSTKKIDNGVLKMTLAIQNTSDQPIKAFKCYLKVKDVFGKVIVSVPYHNYNTIQTGNTDYQEVGLSLNPNKINQIISVKDPNVLRTDWQPLAILFENNEMHEISNHKKIKDEHEVETEPSHQKHKHKNHANHEKH